MVNNVGGDNVRAAGAHAATPQRALHCNNLLALTATPWATTD